MQMSSPLIVTHIPLRLWSSIRWLIKFVMITINAFDGYCSIKKSGVLIQMLVSATQFDGQWETTLLEWDDPWNLWECYSIVL